MTRTRSVAAKDIAGSDGDELSGKRVVLCVSGSVAAYKAIELARQLMRHGADVTCVLSSAATKLIRPEYFRWATGNAPITKLTGDLEHVELADYGRSDLVVVYPATANTIGKLAGGIDDTPVSTVLTVALGSKIPIVVCMAMHAAMRANPAVRRNAAFLRRHVEFVEPIISEGKAKAPEPELVVARILDRFGGSSPLRGKAALVVAGPTSERVDAARSVISTSTGRTGVLLAAELLAAGAGVRMVYGPGRARAPARAHVTDVTSATEMAQALRSELRRRPDIVVMAAAVADYAPASPLRSKIKSGQSQVVIKMKPLPKIIDSVKRACPSTFLVGFKAGAGISYSRLVVEARTKMSECGADIMVANDIADRGRARSRIVIVDASSARRSRLQSAEAHARLIRAELESRLRR